MHRRVRTRVKLLAMITFLMMAGFLATNLVSLEVSRSAVKRAIFHNQLPLTGLNISSQIQTDLLRPVFMSSLMSNDPFLHDWMQRGETDPARIVRHLDEIRATSGVSNAFLVSMASRTFYSSSGLIRSAVESDPRDAWYFHVGESQAPYEIKIERNATQRDAIAIVIGCRLLDDGHIIGVTGVRLTLDAVSQVLSRNDDSDRHSVYFVDDAGTIVLRSDDAPITESSIRDAPGIRSVAGRILSRDNGVFDYVRDSDVMVLTMRRIPELGWRVLVELREADVACSLWRGVYTNIAVGVLIILITVAAIARTIQSYHQRMEASANTDKLTGIANRQIFDAALGQSLSRWRGDRPLALVLFDMDNFKSINDHLGHLKGDEAIQTVAATIQSSLRSADLICRWGGDEIVVLMRDCTGPQAALIADRIRARLEHQTVGTDDERMHLTVSVGIAEVMEGDDADAVLARADRALYAAKAAGRNRVHRADGAAPEEHR